MGVNEWLHSWFSKKNESRNLRIIGSNSLKHPSGDIAFVKMKKSEVVLALNEMSLCGTDSPLPDSLLRGIRTEREDSLVFAEFLNMFQHYLAMLRFNAITEKSSFLVGEKWQSRFALYEEKFSPESLRRFFVKIFPCCKIEVHCFEPLKIKNPAPFILGKSNLNKTNLVGKICTTLTEAMCVDIHGAKPKELPNIKFPFKIKVKFHSKATKIKDFRLGETKLETSNKERWI